MLFRNYDFRFCCSRSLPRLGDQRTLCGWERPEWLSHHMGDGGPGECPDSQLSLHKQETHLCCIKPLCLLGGLFPQHFLSCHDYCVLESLLPICPQHYHLFPLSRLRHSVLIIRRQTHSQLVCSELVILCLPRRPTEMCSGDHTFPGEGVTDILIDGLWRKGVER